MKLLTALLLGSFLLPICAKAEADTVVTIRLWHQLMYAHRDVQAEALREFERHNPGIRVESLYRDTESLRSSFQSAAQVGGGPELIYGPSDQVGPLSTMGLLAPLDDLYSADEFKDFDPLSLVKRHGHLYMVGDNVGNHLSLLYNKKLVANPPRTTEELFAQGRAYKNGFYLVWPMQEPFFFVPWVGGFGESFVGPNTEPRLNTPAMKQALAFIRQLKDSGFVPKEADYETANALFKEGKSAMIINGDWSWGDYKKAKLDFGVTRLPLISSTGKWPSPLVSTKGYSMNVNIKPEKLEATRKLLRFLLSEPVQVQFSQAVSTLPSRLSARNSEEVRKDPLLLATASVMEVGTPMPVDPELRAIWDTLRTQYQAVLGGSVSPEQGAENAQAEAIKQIRIMNEITQPDAQASVVKLIALIALVLLAFYIFKKAPLVMRDMMGPQRLAYGFLMPALLTVGLVIVFPFIYNLVISFSNLSLRTFQDWQITGFQNYTAVLMDPQFYTILWKTVLWTAVNIFFHLSLGVFLAILIDQTLPAKPLLRTLLIIPWAVPQYISALTWRGMFNQEFGAINQVLRDYLMMEPVQWLSKPFEAFSACVLTNVWLGFPFMMMVALGGLQSIPKELYEAARVDGANAWQRFWRITWPLLQPVLIPATVLGGIWTFNNLNVVWLVSNGGEPADQTHILVSYVYKSAFDLYRYGHSAALSMVIFGLLLIATLFYLRVQRRYLTKGLK
ncbi:MAG: extracellular solute-binding protein [Bdellovibrionaceae bacterium]|nr:extracellular solute-binding protein [Pseudobdellovibrionaceae bacterium]